MEKNFKIRLLSSIILIPLCLFFIILGSLIFNIFLFICFVITIFEWQLMAQKKNYKYFGYLFIFFSFYSVYLVRNEDSENSLFIFLFILITCISTDIGGYLFGKIFKGPKLTKISPNKTYSGVFGGFLLSLISAEIFINNSFIITNININEKIEIYILVIMISAVSQIGDISVSFFKRLSNLKDTGKLIPGHGGILDRIDGMIFAFPFYFILNSFNIF